MPLYRFAALTVDMDPKHPTLRDRAARYLISDGGVPDIRLRMPAGFPDLYRQSHPGLSDDDCEYQYHTGIFYRRLLRFGGMMLHASAVAYAGRAYLFTAPPGTGKSTHTAAWLAMLGDRAVILNDDKPALRWLDGQIYACGTPFSGRSPLSENLTVPVGGICMLHRGAENRIRRATAEEAIPFLYRETIHRLTRADTERMLDFLVSAAEKLPLYRMECGVGPEAARCAFAAMVGEEPPAPAGEGDGRSERE